MLLPGVIESDSCSVIYARPEITADHHARLARNYDWPDRLPDITLMFTHPQGGYPTAIMTPRTPGLSAADGLITTEGLMDILAEIRGSTQWSIVYDLQDLSLTASFPDDGFSETYAFSLAEFIDRVENE